MGPSTLEAALDVTIGTGVTSGGYFQFGRWYPTASPCHINVNDLIIELSDRNVRIDTVNGSVGAESGDVIIAATVPVDNLPTTIARTLTINAQRNIAINGAFSQAVAGGDNSPNPLSLVLNGNQSGGGTGTVAISNSVATSGGGITISSAALTIANGIPVITGGGALNASLSGSLSMGTAYVDTDGAGISIAAAGGGSSSAGMFTDGGALSLTTTGNLTVSGTMDARLGANTGSVLVRSTTGTLTLASTSQAQAGSAGTATIRAFQKLTISGPVSGGAVWVEAEGGFYDTEMTSTGSLSSIAGGVTVRAGNYVTLSGSASANGTLEVVADTNAGGVGDATVGAALSTQGQPILVSGHNVSMTGVLLNSNGGNVTLTAHSGALSHSGSIASGGGSLQISGDTFTLNGAITTSGGSATFNGASSGAINNDITTSGGNLTVSLNGTGAILSKSAGSDCNAGAGAGTSKISILAPEGSLGPWLGRVEAGSGGIEITASGALTLIDEIQSNGGPVDVTLSGTGALLTLEGTTRATGGSPSANVKLRSMAGGVLVKPLAVLSSGTAGSLWIETEGNFNDLTVQGSLTSGSGGTTLRSKHNVSLQTALNTNGPITIAADTNAGGVGDATVAAALSTQGQTIGVSGNNVSMTGVLLNSNGGNVTLTAHTGSLSHSGSIATGGGNLQISGNTFTLYGAITTWGGSATFNGSSAGSIQNDITTSGGNVTALMTGSGSSISAAAGSDLNASGGAGTSRVSILVPAGTFGPWPSAISSGSGGVEISAEGSSTLAGQITATSGPVDVTLTGTGAVLRVENQVSATYTGSANVTLRSLAGPLQLASTANLQAANTVVINGQQGVALDGDIPTAGSVDVDCGTGNIAIGATASITNSGALIAFDAADSTITVAAGASISPGLSSKLHLQTAGLANSLALSVPLTAGSGGIELISNHHVQVNSSLTTNGPVTLHADADANGSGALSTSIILADNQPVTLRGSGISVNGLVNTNTGEIRIQPAASTTAVVPAALDGPTRLMNGVTRFTGGNVAGGSLTIDNGAACEFDGPSRSLSPTGFGQSGPLGETRLRIGGNGAGQFNRILSSGALSAGGKLVVQFEPGYVPATGHSFQVLQFLSFSGSFASVTLPVLGTGLVWDTSQLSVSGVIRILSPIEAWKQQYFGTTANSGNAADDFDFDNDSLVNLIEFAFGLNPTIPDAANMPQPQHIGNELVYSFTPPTAVSGIIYGAQSSETLAPGDWHPVPDTGTPPIREFRIAVGTKNKDFVRLTITGQAEEFARR